MDWIQRFWSWLLVVGAWLPKRNETHIILCALVRLAMILHSKTSERSSKSVTLAHVDATHIVGVNAECGHKDISSSGTNKRHFLRLCQFWQTQKMLGVEVSHLKGNVAAVEKRGPSKALSERLYTPRGCIEKLLNHSQKRPTRVCVLGAYVEDDITHFCLEALAEGLETFLIADLSLSRQSGYSQLLIQRLIFAGVVPTTAFQLISEWGLSEYEPSKSAYILRLAQIQSKLH